MGKFTTISLASIALLACGSGDKDESVPDAAGLPQNVDAAPVADAMPQNVCTDILAMYGNLGEVTGVARVAPIDSDEPDGPRVLTIEMPLNQDAEADVLFLEFWETEEPFLSQGLVPLTQSLGGDQADLVTCGACAYIAANYSEGSLIDFNMAYAGELEIEAIDVTPLAGSVTGTLSGLKFRQVTVSKAGQETVEDGCRSELEAIRFNFRVVTDPE